MLGRGVPYVDGGDLGVGGSVCVLGREESGRGGNGPDDANNIILVK